MKKYIKIFLYALVVLSLILFIIKKDLMFIMIAIFDYTIIKALNEI